MTRRRFMLGLAGVALVLLAWAAVVAVQARGDAVRARGRLEAVRAGNGDTSSARVALRKARSDLRSARSRLRQPGPWLVARTPLLGRSWVALDRTAAAALAVVETGDRALAVVDGGPPLLANHRVDLVRLAALRVVFDQEATRLRPAIAALDALHTRGTPPQVGSGVRKARRELSGVPDALKRAADGIDALTGITGRDRPRRLLIGLENNAELRGTGGLVSVFAEATAKDGRLEIGGFRDIHDIAESAPFARPVHASPEFQDRYGSYLAATTLWRNANMAPDVPTSARVMADLAALSLRRRPDVVLLLDVRTFAAVLDAAGPASLPDGRQITGANALDELLVRAYADAPDTRAGQDARRRRLRAIADAVVNQLFSGDASPIALGRELASVAVGRHLALWSAVPSEQAALDSAGLSGAVHADSTDLAMVTVHNLGGGGGEGNKLDYYARRLFRVSAEVDRRRAVTTQTFRLRNTAPATGLPLYVSGIEHPGESRNLVSFAMPAGATLEFFERDGAAVRTSIEPEGGHLVVDDIVALAPGKEATWTLRYATPLHGSRYSLRVIPQPLAVDSDLDVRVHAAGDAALSGRRRISGAWMAEHHLDLRVRRAGAAERFRRRIGRFWREPLY